MNLAWGQPGPTELLIILVIILLLFGANKLPGLSRALGKSLGEFKKGKQDGEKSDSASNDDSDNDDAEEKSEGDQ